MATATKVNPREPQLTITQVAEQLNCSRGHIYNLIAAGKIRSSDIGIRTAKTRIPESALGEYLERVERRPWRTDG